MKLEELEVLTIVETKEYRTFKDKLNITKKYDGKAKMEIYKDYIYVEKKEYKI